MHVEVESAVVEAQLRLEEGTQSESLFLEPIAAVVDPTREAILPDECRLAQGPGPETKSFG
jgi:hypothetical protein